MTPAAPSDCVIVGAQTDIILPPPTPLNPIPSLSAALRFDNQEQLLHFLLQSPESLAYGGNNVRQLLIFGTDSLRTLIMRQVLTNPHTNKSAAMMKAGKKKKNYNWDPIHSYPDLPKELNVVGTRILQVGNDTLTNDDSTAATASLSNSLSFAEEQWKQDGFGDTETIDMITYFLRPDDLEHTQRAFYHYQVWKSGRKKKNSSTHHRFVYLPQLTSVVQKVHTNLGLTSAPNTSIHALQLDLFPLETDVLSLEYDSALKQDVIESTPSTLVSVCARSLLKLQDVVGPIPRIQTYGPLGEEVLKKLLNLTVDEYLASNQDQESSEASSSVVEGGDVAALVIMDRKCDMATPMVTSLTYEGLLDDVVGIDSGFINVDVNTINPNDDDNNDNVATSPNRKAIPQKEMVALGVNGSDSLYAEVRNQHVEQFGSFLQNQARALQQSHAKFTDKTSKKELSEIHQFVKQMPIFTQNLRSLTNHIHLAELVKKTSEEATFRERWQIERSMLEGDLCYEELDDLVASQYPPYRFFRLLCLQSICSGGIKSSRYDSLRRDVVQTYGYEYLFVLTNLEKAGLLRRREGLWMDTASPFNTLRKLLILINAEVDTVDPDDISYISSGYAPISVRLLQTAVKGWAGREDILKELPGRHQDVTQKNPPEDIATTTKKRPSQHLGAWALSKGDGKKKPVLVVMYVGGVSYMEIAALRFLSKRPSFPYHVICITTKIVNGATMLQSLS